MTLKGTTRMDTSRMATKKMPMDTNLGDTKDMNMDTRHMNTKNTTMDTQMRVTRGINMLRTNMKELSCDPVDSVGKISRDCISVLRMFYLLTCQIWIKFSCSKNEIFIY